MVSGFSALLLILLIINAVISFLIAFYFQAKVIQKVCEIASFSDFFSLQKSVDIGKNFNANFLQFLTGSRYPELRRKWAKALIYVIVSYLLLFVVAGYQGLLRQ